MSPRLARGGFRGCCSLFFRPRFVDNLPAAHRANESGEIVLIGGFRLGRRDEAPKAYKEKTPILNNHYDIIVEIHPYTAEDGSSYFSVVGVIVNPFTSVLTQQHLRLFFFEYLFSFSFSF